MSPELQSILDALRQLSPVMVWAALFAGALAEYVVPPVPGDLVVVAGAVLVAVFDWALWPVFVATTAGSVLGAGMDWGAGVWLGGRSKAGLPPRLRRTVDELIARFQRYGRWYLLLNRFMPGVRALFFVAAGMAGMGLGVVLLYAGISAAVWNAVLLGVGYILGENVALLERLVTQYTAVVLVVVLVFLVVVVGRVWHAVR